MVKKMKDLLLQLGTDQAQRSQFFNGGKEEMMGGYELTKEEKVCLQELTEDKLVILASNVSSGVQTSDIRI